MPTSDEDLQSLQEEVQQLRDKVAAEDAKAAERVRQADNDIAAAQLTAERTRLQGQLAQAKEASKASNIKAGAGAPLAAARADMALAVEQAKQQEALRAADEKAAKGSSEDETDPMDPALVSDQASTKGAAAKREV